MVKKSPNVPEAECSALIARTASRAGTGRPETQNSCIAGRALFAAAARLRQRGSSRPECGEKRAAFPIDASAPFFRFSHFRQILFPIEQQRPFRADRFIPYLQTVGTACGQAVQDRQCTRRAACRCRRDKNGLFLRVVL